MLNLKKTLPVITIILVVIFGFNPLLKMGLEKGGSAAFGAKTEIAGFFFNPLFGRLNLRRIQVANKNAPMTNLFEVGAFRLGLSTEQLLYKRVNIEAATIDNIRLGTPRQYSGTLPVKAKKAEQPKEKFDLNKFSREMQINPDALAIAFQTTPPQAEAEAARVKKENEQKLAEAKKLLASIDVQKEIAALNLAELSNMNISSPEDLQKWQGLFEAKQKGLQKITETIEANKTGAERSIKEAEANLVALNQTMQKDIDNLLETLDIGNYDLGAIGKELLGPKINGWLDTGTHYLGLAQKYMPPKKAKAEKKPKKERLQGVTVVFPNNKTRPRFWIGRLGLSGISAEGTNNELKYSGYITDIASEQHILGQPTVLKIDGAFTQRAQSSLAINAVIDRREETNDRYDFLLSGYDLTGMQFSQTIPLPLRTLGGLGQINGTLAVVNDELDGEIVFSGKNMRYQKMDLFTNNDLFEPQRPSLISLIAEAIQSAPELTVRVFIAGTLDAPELRINTNLDALIKARLEKEFGEQINKAREQVTAEYTKIVGDTQKELDNALRAQEKELTAALTAQQSALDAEKEKLTAKQKEIEEQFNSQIDSAKKQAEDALKNALPGIKF